MINLGAETFTEPQKLGQLLQEPREPESQELKQPILPPTEKVLTEVRGSFKMYGINIAELQKHEEKFQGVIYPLKFLSGRISQEIK